MLDLFNTLISYFYLITFNFVTMSDNQNLSNSTEPIKNASAKNVRNVPGKDDDFSTVSRVG